MYIVIGAKLQKRNVEPLAAQTNSTDDAPGRIGATKRKDLRFPHDRPSEEEGRSNHGGQREPKKQRELY